MAAKAAKPRKVANRQKSAVFSTRMDPSLKRQIQKSAKLHSRGNLSLEMDRLLKLALATEKQTDKSVRAIGYLLGQVAKLVSAPLGEHQARWRNDPWVWKAFLAGSYYLLMQLAPEGEPVTPTVGGMLSETAQADVFGMEMGTLVWRLFVTVDRPPPDLDVNVPKGSWFYAMPQARDDLDVKYDLPLKMMLALLQKGDKQ